ncbi:autotransporter-associated beta strand repeat-containing protein [Dyella koreensis]|uniref:Autotransporter-associated beta strand repeat-containing protein n=1 Tax=Dyella koreensis TaxID=311235 RepID=A0ABW8K4B7_9GAMM
MAIRHRPTRLALALLAVLYAGVPLAAHATCTIGASSATCDNTAPNPYTAGVGNGTQNNYTVTVNAGTSTANAGQISAGNAEAIAINTGGTINIGDYASVINTATTGGGPTGTGNNTIDFNSNTTMTVGVGATVLSNGTAPTAEAINPRGTGNTIINNGLIQGNPSFAIYFESGSSTNTVINNATGIIRSTHGAIGGNPGANTIFTNRGLIDGNLVFLGKNDQLTLYTGSQITGSLKGGGGNDSITLAGSGSQSLPGSIQGFATLKKIDPGAWTLTGAITGNLNVNVNQGTLTVTGNNTGFTGSIVVDPAGTLAGQASALPPSVTDNGQVLFTQIADSAYAGLISGSGGVTKSGNGILSLTKNETYTGGTTISAGELQLGNGGTTGSVLGNVTDNGSLSFNRSDTVTFPGTISGTGAVRQIGSGTTILTGAETYSGGTIVDTGMLQLGNGGTTGSIAGNVTVNGNGTLAFNRSDIVTFPGIIAGSGNVAQTGSGTTIFTGANTYTGRTTISSGTLQIGSGGTSGAINGDIIDNSALVFNRSDTVTYAGTISGTGSLTQAGSGTLILTSDNTATGPTTIAAGTLQLGNGSGAAGSVAGNITDNGALVFNHRDTMSYAGAISGTGTLTQAGANTLTLSGTSTYTGLTTVASSRLNVDGSIAGDALVNASATLGGSGTVSGAVTIANGGHLSPGDSPGTLHVGSLLLNSGSQLDYELGLPNIVGGSTNDLTEVAGNLTLAGTLNISDAGGFGNGVYRIFDYGGALTNNGLALGTLPNGFVTSDFLVQTSVPSQVNLIVSGGGFSLQFWDGPNTTANGVVDGGTSVWDTTTTHWTNASGSANAPWSNGFAVFEGTAGTVTLGQNVAFTGMQFLTDGYQIQGNGFTLAGDPSTVIRVDPGITAIVNAAIVDGSGGATTVIKRDSGRLVLSGTNTYTGGTFVDEGVLQVAADNNLGAASGALTFNGGTLATTASFTSARHVTLNANGGTLAPVAGTILTLGGTVDGAGALTKTDAGTLSLSGTNTYGGGTILNSGTLAVSSDANLGAATSGLDFTGGTLRLDASFNPAATRAITLDLPGGSIDTHGNTTVLAQQINGNGALTKLGAGSLVLTGNNVYDGGTTISAGTLQLGNGGASGSVPGNIVDNGTLVFNRNDSLTYTGTISGSGTLVQAGSGTTILTGNSTYTGGTTISSGTLQVSDGGTLGDISGNVTNNSALIFNHSDTLTFGGAITGTGTLAQNGNGTLIITNSVTESGATTINAGTLSIGNGTVDGTVATDIVDNSALVFNRSDATYGNVISGTGTVEKQGTSTLTLTGANTYAGLTTISGGTLQVGNGGTTGTLGSGQAVVDNATLSFNRSDAVTYAGAISGSGNFAQIGGGTLTLTGNSTYTGTTTVGAGTLLVNGSLGNTAVTVNSGTTLGGAGIIAGPVTINGGTLAPGAQIGAAGTLYVGGLTLHSQLNYDLAMPNVVGNPNDLINDTGDLSLNGVLNVNDTGQFASTPGSYRLINYDGALSGPGLTLGSIPGGANEAVIQTAVPNQVNLIKFINGLPVQFWDGVPANGSNSVIDGGNGIWNNSSGNWTNVTGNINQSWIPGMAIFTATAGTVTLGEPVTASALQFLTNGYRIEGNGNALTLTALPGGAAPMIRVDPGVTATINAVLAGNQGLNKADPGTLVLSAANTYTGGTTISNGTLQIGEGGTAGSIVGDIADNGVLSFNRSDTSTFVGVVSGAGSLSQIGSGTTVLTGSNTYTGGTTISTGTLQIGDGGTSGSIVGDVTDNSVLSFNRSDTSAFPGAVSGTGSLTQIGSGTTVLTGNSSYSGGTTISAGTLQIGNGGTSGSITGNVSNNSVLSFNRSDSSTFAGVVSGTGSLMQIGSGTTVLTGSNTYTGGTTISAGTLQIGDGGTSGSIVGNVTDNATLSFNRSDTSSFPGVISGSGSLTQIGSGTTVLTGNNTYSGGTTISSGALQLGAGGTSGNVTGNITDNATLIFDRSDTVTYADVVSGTGNLIQAGSGTTLLTGANTYTGATTVNAGTLELDGSLTSDITVQAGGTLSGIGSTTGNLINLGVVAPDPPALTGSLLVGGNYAGQGGSLLIKTVLNAGGPGNQTTDRLLIEGNVSGTTPLNIQALPGGTPALTSDTNTSGISVVQVGGTANAAAFQLPHGFVASGPYELRLYQFPAGASATSEIDPRLAAAGIKSVADYRLQVPVVQPPTTTTNTGTLPPATQPGPGITGNVTPGGFTTNNVYVPAGLPVGEGPNGEAPGEAVVLPQVVAYRALPPAVFSYGFALADDLHKRLGDIEQSANAPNSVETFARYSNWSGSQISNQLPNVKQDLWYLQVGAGWIDRNLLSEGDQLHLDAIGSLGSTHLNVPINHARLSFDAQSLGGTATYMAARGWYLDAVLQSTYYRHISASTMQQGVLDRFGGHGWLASLEGGYPFQFNGTTIEPRASIAYQRVSFDHTVDLDQVALQLKGDDSVLGRAGIRAEHPLSFGGDAYHLITPFLTLDYAHDFRSGKREQLDNIGFATASAGSSLRFGGGVTAQIGPMWNAYVTFERSLARGSRGSTGTEGTAGVRYVF